MQRRPYALVALPSCFAEYGEGVDRDAKLSEWHAALCSFVIAEGYEPVELYCLRDDVKPKYRQPYFPEKEGDEQSAKNAIRIVESPGSNPIEISEICPRLLPVTHRQVVETRHYVPREIRDKARQLRSTWTPS
jgi:hypothetical protein